MNRRLYAAYHRVCRHARIVSASRTTLAALADQVPAEQRHKLRTRVATDADILGIAQGVRCATCTLDGVVTA